MKKLLFVKTTVTFWIPVCSRTSAEAVEIAQESAGDVLGIMYGKLPDGATVAGEWCTDEQPNSVADDATVWGECVPEEHCEVAKLRAHLAEQSK